MPAQPTRYTPNPDRPWEHDESANPLAAAKAFQQQVDTTDPGGRSISQTSGPQIGDRHTQDGITGEWDGQTWRQVGADAPEQSASSRFTSGFASTSPLNPLNALHALMHPIDTVGDAVATSVREAGASAGHFSDAVTNPGNEGGLGRLSELLQGVEHLGGAVPFIGKSGINAGEKIGDGDVAGGAGELAGIASGAAVPEIARRTPGGMSTVGGWAERAGDALISKDMGTPLGRFNIPGAGLAEALLRQDPKGLAVAAAPYALKYGGKGLKWAGDSLQGLMRDPIEGEVVPPDVQDGEYRDVTPPKSSSAPSWGTDVARSGSTSAPASDTLPRGELPPAGDMLLEKGGDFNMGPSTTGALPPHSGTFEMPPSSERFMSDINPAELKYSGDLPQGDVSVVDPGEPPSHAGQEVPGAADVEELIKGLMPQGEATGSPVPSFRALSRGDEYWGPGAKTRTGDPAMADDSGRMLYDPQTPSDYLRQQLRAAKTPAEKDFLLRAYRQRLNIQKRPGTSSDATR